MPVSRRYILFFALLLSLNLNAQSDGRNGFWQDAGSFFRPIKTFFAPERENIKYLHNEENWSEENSELRLVVGVEEGGLSRVEFPLRSGRFLSAPVGVKIIKTGGGQVKDYFIREANEDEIMLAFQNLGAGEYYIYIIEQQAEKPNDKWAESFNIEDYLTFKNITKAKNLAKEFRYKKYSNKNTAHGATQTEIDSYIGAAKEPFRVFLLEAGETFTERNRIPQSFVKLQNEKFIPKTWRSFRRWVVKTAAPKKADNGRQKIVIENTGQPFILQFVLMGGAEDTHGMDVSFPEITGLSAGIKLLSPPAALLESGKTESVLFLVSPKDKLKDGVYTADISFSAAGGIRQNVPIEIIVRQGSGENETARLYLVNEVQETQKQGGGFHRFPAINSEAWQVKSDEKTIRISKETSLPEQILTGGRELLKEQVLLVLKTKNGTRKIGLNDVAFSKRSGHSLSWSGDIQTHDMALGLSGTINSFGLMTYTLNIEPLSKIEFENISLEFGFSDNVSELVFENGRINQSVKLYPHKGQRKVYAGSLYGGLDITIPPVEGNLLYNSRGSSIDIYSGGGYSVLVSSGKFLAAKGENYTLVYQLQLLPAAFAAKQNFESRTYFADETLPDDGQLRGVSILVLTKPWVNLASDEQRLKELKNRGLKIEAYFNGFSLPCSSPLVDYLALLGYKSVYNREKGLVNFERDASLEEFFIYEYKQLVSNPFFSGAVLLDDGFNIENTEKLYDIAAGSKNGFTLSMHMEAGRQNSALSATPWLERLYFYLPKGTQDINIMTESQWDGLFSTSRSGLRSYLPFSHISPWQSLINAKSPVMAAGSISGQNNIRYIWNTFSALGLSGAKFYDERQSAPFASVSNKNIKLASYVFEDKIYFICRNASGSRQRFSLNIDGHYIGVPDYGPARLKLPKIDGLQEESLYFMDSTYLLEAGEGVCFELDIPN